MNAKSELNQIKALELLLTSNLSQQDIAIELGVTPETVSRWINNDAEFGAMFNAARLARLQNCIFRVELLTLQALDVFEDILRDDDAPLRLKLQAASRLLAYSKLNTDPSESIGHTDAEALSAHRSMVQFARSSKLVNGR